ncbi:hypothetical protein [Streptomyces sp. SID13031]|uniref:hypothetical protein n=1 Tax=Streptomyces sp. SID13031 TaxID=2706046 RepID=UPI0013C9E56B|nr:hypothetical protein [Streptomyces sp. SID13031]NEA34578.1 hypothetical protein [Streptomyces sp. SID13031]
MTDYPGEQFPPAVDPDVEPGREPRPGENAEPDYDTEPGPDSHTPWVNPTLQGRPHTDPLLAGFTVYGDPTPEPDPEEDTEQAFEASLEEPERHSFVDDGPDDWSDDTSAAGDEPVPVAPSAGAAGGSTPGSAFPRPAGPTPGQAFPRPAATSATQSYTQQTPAAPAPRPGAYVPGAPAAPRPAAPSYTQQAPAAPTPAPPVPAAPAPSAPRPVVPVPAAPAAVVRAEERGEDEVHPLVEETMERLDGLRDKPVGEHADVYADLHERLQSALVEADADHGDRG